MLDKENTCLQVENWTLQLQSSSLLAQINTLQSDHHKLESELTRTTHSEKEMKQELNQLIRQNLNDCKTNFNQIRIFIIYS